MYDGAALVPSLAKIMQQDQDHEEEQDWPCHRASEITEHVHRDFGIQ